MLSSLLHEKKCSRTLDAGRILAHDSMQGDISPSFRRGYTSTSLGLQQRKRHASSLAWNGERFSV